MWQPQQQRPGAPAQEPDWLQAGYYHNIPHGEVNWGALAQQWIAMREIVEHQNVQRQMQMQQQEQQQQMMFNRMNVPIMPAMPHHQPQPPLPSIHSDMPPPPPPDHSSPFQYPPAVRAPLYSQPPHFYEQGPGPGPSYGEPRMLFPSGGRFPHPTVGAMGPQASPFHPPLGGNASGGHESMAMTPPIISKPSSFVPSLLTTDFQPPPGFVPPASLEAGIGDHSTWQRSTSRDDATVSPEASMIDIQMRKQLPAWIREGLEKVEKEKLKQQQQQKEQQDDVATTEKGGRIPRWKLEDAEGGGSDVEAVSTGDTVEGRRKSDGRFNLDADHSVVDGSSSESENEIGDSPEEIREQLLAKVRFWMTSVLLEVTSSEITNVVQSFYKSSRATGSKGEYYKGHEDEERDTANSASDTDGNEESIHDTGSSSPGEVFKMPVAPPTSKVTPVSKKNATNALNGGKSEPPDGSVTAEQGEHDHKEENAQEKSSSSSEEKKESSSKTGHSSHHEDSKSKREHKRRHRSRSRSRSRSRERDRERKRDHSRRSRSRSPSSRSRDKKRRDEERSSGSKSHRTEGNEKKYSKERSSGSSRHRR